MKQFETNPVYIQICERLAQINKRSAELERESLSLRRDIQMLLEKYQKEDNND
jgi:hypothetical protein